MFIQQAPVNSTQMLKLAKEEKWPEVKALAHKMKSSVTLIGNQDLAAICEEIQKYAATPGQNHFIPHLVLRMKDICDKAVAELKLEIKSL